MKILSKFKSFVVIALLLLLCSAVIWFFLWWFGPSNSELKRSIETETESVRTHVTECSSRMESKLETRADELEKRLDRLDAKLDGIDAKLDNIGASIDKMIRLINPPLPDGIKRVE